MGNASHKKQSAADPANTPHKLCVVGDKKVGKTALIMRFVQGTYEGTPSDDCRYERSFVLDGSTVQASIIDVSAMDSGSIEAARDDQIMKEFVTRTSEGIMLVYDITDKTSFEYCVNFEKNPLRLAYKDDPDKPIVLVGNKMDMDHARVVSTTEGKELAEQKGWYFFETSATKTAYDINEVFGEILRQIAKGHVSSAEKSSKG